MYKNIVVAVDGSDASNKAFAHSLKLAQSLSGTLTVVTVTDRTIMLAPGAEIVQIRTEHLIDAVREAKAAEAKAILDAAEQQAKAAGVSAVFRHITENHTADGILEAADAENADLIVMGSNGRRGLSRMLLGSQANEVLVRSTRPVLIVR